jgi:hypothetical protein
MFVLSERSYTGEREKEGKKEGRNEGRQPV